MNDDEAIAAAWLRARGFEPEFQPGLVTRGRSPDFLAKSSAAPRELWAEVKTIDPEAVTTVMGRASDIIHATELPEGLRGHGTMFVNPDTRDQSVRALLRLFSEHAPKFRDKRVQLIFIQQQADARGMRRLDFLDKAVPQHFWVRGAGQGKIGVPAGVLDDGLCMATFEVGNEVRQEHAFNIFDWNGPLNCALVAQINAIDYPLSISPMGGGIVSVASRVLNAVESANGQIKNGCKYLSAPGVVLIVPSPSGFVDDRQIAAAAYGRLTMSINISSGEASGLQHGPGAAFQQGKNRHVSAIIRLHRDGTPGMYFPNLHAHNGIDKSSALFAGLECYPPALE